MRRKLIASLSILVLFFAVCYMAWQAGRAFGKGERADYVYVDCKPTDNVDELLCDLYEINTPALIQAYENYRKVYEQVLKEINSPSDPQSWIDEYEERQERKLGL